MTSFHSTSNTGKLKIELEAAAAEKKKLVNDLRLDETSFWVEQPSEEMPELHKTGHI